MAVAATTIGASGKPSLRPGKYLIKVFVDAQARLAKDWRGELGPDDYVGQAVVETDWPEGFERVTEVPADRLRR